MRPENQIQKHDLQEQLRKLEAYEAACEEASLVCAKADAVSNPSGPSAPRQRFKSPPPIEGGLVETVVKYTRIRVTAKCGAGDMLGALELKSVRGEYKPNCSGTPWTLTFRIAALA